MRRVLPPDAIRDMADRLPAADSQRRSADWLAPGVVTDPSDRKLAHLDGLNLSRAWMLEGIAAGLPANDRRARRPARRRRRATAPPASPPSPASTTRAATGWAASRSI